MKKVSFSALQKADIMNTEVKNTCCRRAMLDGILCAKAYNDSGSVRLSVESDAPAEYVSELINEIFLKKPEITKPIDGGRCRIITFTSNSASKYISKFESEPGFIEVCRQKCAACHSAFWRGVFLVSGRITDPEKSFFLEFSLGERMHWFKQLFHEQELEATENNRKKECMLYFKRKSDIQDFFAKAGMNNTVFSLLNSYIITEIRQSVNRVSNCERNNITRAVDASQKYVNAINDLIEANLLSSLPDELYETAKLRLENSDLSISQLAAISIPPISKPGLSHRLNKILIIAEKKIGKKYK